MRNEDEAGQDQFFSFAQRACRSFYTGITFQTFRERVSESLEHGSMLREQSNQATTQTIQRSVSFYR